MRICHVTPHLPPDQAANALLPFHLGCWAKERGDEVTFVTNPPRSSADLAWASSHLPGQVVYIPVRRDLSAVQRLFKLGTMSSLLSIWRKARHLIAGADIVHVHSNGLLTEIAGTPSYGRQTNVDALRSGSNRNAEFSRCSAC